MRWSIYATCETPEEAEQAVNDAADAALEKQPFNAYDKDVEKQIKLASQQAKRAAKLLKDEVGNFAIFAGGNTGATDVDAAVVSVSVSRGPGIIHHGGGESAEEG